MKYRTVSWYQEFRCIGGSCEDSCCENWEIDLDDESLKTYMKQPGVFGKRLRDNTRVKEKQFILRGTRCPFLNGENLCDIFIEMGEDCLCQTCTNFPRHMEEYDDLKEVSLTMSCPEASRIMLSKTEKMEFVCKEGTDRDYGLKEMKPVKTMAFWKRKHVNKMDGKLYPILCDARAWIFNVLQNREVPVCLRAAMVLKFADELQGLLNTLDYDGMKQCVKDYCEKEHWQELSWYETYKNRGEEKKQWMKQVLNMYQGLETIKEEWVDLLNSGMDYMQSQEEYGACFESFWKWEENREYEFEHILVYYIFNYFLGASYDRDILTKVKFAVISYLVILELDVAYWLMNQHRFQYEDQVLVAHAYSKEVEHSYNNFESLQLVLSAHPVLDTEHLLLGLLS